jgi:uncharacterized protein YndB with AHSA1/START domain
MSTTATKSESAPLAAGSANDYGVFTEPTTLVIERTLPGPIERVWKYLTDSELRRKWLAAGDMEMKSGSTFKLTWRNDELTNPPGQRPDGFGAEHSMESRLLECDPPHRLVFTWNDDGDVAFDLAEQGDEVHLTVTHRRLTTPRGRFMVGAGWHMHLDVLRARLKGTEPVTFWDGWAKLRAEYEARLTA